MDGKETWNWWYEMGVGLYGKSKRLFITADGGGSNSTRSRLWKDDFWANDILWQLSVFAYNLSVMMRQKKNRFKRQEHFTLLNLSCRTTYLTGQAFIDWFIEVLAKITRSGHQIELKLYSLSRESGNIIFTKPTGKSLMSSSKRHKNKERRKL